MRTPLISTLLCSAAVILRADEKVLIVHPWAGERLTPGETVTVAWGEIGQDADEQELLFSLDGGAHFRGFTGKFGPGTRSYQWTVPWTASDRVVLVVRVGRDGRESVAGRSAVFAIARDAADPLEAGEPPSIREGAGEALWPPAPENWEGEVPLTSGSLGSRWLSVPSDSHCAEQGVRGFAPDPGGGRELPEARRKPAGPALSQTFSSRPSLYPLRQ